MFKASCPSFLRVPPGLVGAARPRAFHDLPPLVGVRLASLAVRAENISEFIPPARKIQFGSCE